MQYPPQQQSGVNQPYYAPAEIYLYDHQQAPISATHSGLPRPRQENQEIAIYYNQKLLLLYKRTCKVLLVCLIILLILLAFLVLSAFIPRMTLALGTPPIESGDILPITLSFVILLAAIVLLTWWTRVISSLSGPIPEPVLHITSEGITIQHNIMVKYRFIRWNEMKTLYAGNMYLKIRSVALLPPSASNARQPPRYRLKRTLATLAYLDTPSSEVFRQICEVYAYELSYYNIQLQP